MVRIKQESITRLYLVGLTSAVPRLYMKHLICSLIVTMAAFTPSATVADSERWPLVPLADDHTRNYWLPEQVNAPDSLERFQHVISAPAQEVKQAKAIRIAVIYPNADVSDFWSRSYLAMTRRLEDLGIPFKVTEFESRQIEHSLQTRYTEQVIANKDKFDFVIFGPSELAVQAKNIESLAAEEGFETLVWAFHTPLKSLSRQPLMWLDFSSAVGAEALCNYMLARLGKDVAFAMNRGIPGVTDDQRSGEFKDCVTQKGNWQVVYEHFGQYQRSGGADGADLVSEYYPEVRYLHNANTAMTMGVVDALERAGDPNRFLVTGWGGTALELQALRGGQLNATPMRMNDDLGVATAEAIRFVLASRQAELPRVYLGRITVAHDRLSAQEVDDMEVQAFRYSNMSEPSK